MGCGTTSTTTEKVAGCGSGGCSSGGCNRLNVYDWLSDMPLAEGQKPFNIVEVRFKGTRKDFFRNVDALGLRDGDIVAVESMPGHDIGTVSMVGEMVRLQLKKKQLTENSPEIKNIYRIARTMDIEKWESMKALEVKTMYRARVIALDLGLKMKLSDVEFQGDGKKATFYYTAEERVDFRELIKKLAEEFKIRVEMRQIGLRQEAGRLGGIGSCGRELCCSTWLTKFQAVSTNAARYQNLALNPQKLAGQCGKLKCCLNYELDGYMEALKDVPDSDLRLETQKGRAVHRKTDIFKRMMWYEYLPDLAEGQMFISNADNWVALDMKRVREIIELNSKKIKPAELNDADDEEETVVAEPDYKDVVGQDSLTRMDRKKKKKKKRRHGNRPGDRQDSRPNNPPNP